MTDLRKLAYTEVPAVGLGCMNLSHAYGVPPAAEDAKKVLQKALDLGITHFDSAALYGAGKNESLVGPFLKPVRKEIFLVSKCVLFLDEQGNRRLDGRPEAIRESVEASLKRLQTEVIDLMYLHRLDPDVPIEDSVGTLSDLREEGKIRSIGLSEMSAETIHRAAAVDEIAAVQSEYSLWSRNVEIGVLEACHEVGAAFVAFSPVARGFLADLNLDPQAFAEKDIRRNMPRFQDPHFSENRETLLPRYREIAEEVGCTPAQLAIAWLLHRGDNIHVIPGTTSAQHLEEDWHAGKVILADDQIDDLDRLINQYSVSGPRYAAAVQAQIDTEEF